MIPACIEKCSSLVDYAGDLRVADVFRREVVGREWLPEFSSHIVFIVCLSVDMNSSASGCRFA